MLKRIIIGVFAGFICGFFGSGGGMILVPAFVHLLSLSEKEARATSVFAILPMVIVSMFFYFQADYIDWELGTKSAIGGMIGGYIGSKLLNKAQNQTLQLFFMFFLIYVSIKMIFF